MRVLDLFSGIGGFSLGLERAGMETVAFCEQDKACQKVLKKHWPDIPIYQDVRKLNGSNFERNSIDLICGGFPCQPFSQAGKRKGAADDRHLWPEYFRLIQEIRPRWVLGENVAGIINMGLDQVLSDLESENYSCQTIIIPACAVNAPHRRDRVWIVANAIFTGSQKRSGECLEKIQDRRTYTELSFEKPGGHVAHPPSKQGNGEGPGGLSTKSSQCSWWDVEPGMGRVANGVPGRVDRLKQLGNAVVPQIVEIIGKAIMEADQI